MSLDTLLSILFVVVFIVLPLVSRALRRSSGTPSGPSRPARPSQPPGEGSAAPNEAAPGGASAGEGPPWLVEAQRRVREAQARGAAEASTEASRPAPQAGGTLVPEDPFGELGRANGGEAAAPSAPPAPPSWAPPAQRSLVPQDPFGKGLAEGAGERRAGPLLGREGEPAAGDVPPSTQREPQPPPGPRALQWGERRRGRASSGWGAVAGAYGRPHREGMSARLGVVGLLRFEREAIVRGLIWHEILDEPAWKRRRGRPLSPRR